MKALIILMLLIAQPVFADTAQNISKGQPAPYDGVIMDKERSEKVRDELIDKDALVKTNESLNKSIKLYQSNEDILNGQKQLLLNQNIELTKTLNDTRETSTLTKVGFFLLGVAVTSAAVYGATRLAK